MVSEAGAPNQSFEGAATSIEKTRCDDSSFLTLPYSTIGQSLEQEEPGSITLTHSNRRIIDAGSHRTNCPPPYSSAASWTGDLRRTANGIDVCVLKTGCIIRFTPHVYLAEW
ncbi:hypothetical protein PROFUN_00662 [Planoprotostelium fungivorum]|uniref:Uncharacterized protein n=1 Tax=Planoprotostelium fungivorum TaxID=1890364 RepID=A0A2P6NU22_9EUKA|nr:hypothetical protein PROFUN_00662 [Planoprotostelium fungivorum]